MNQGSEADLPENVGPGKDASDVAVGEIVGLEPVR